MKLRVYGKITAYERSSQFQILVEKAEEAGLGDLQKKFAELKEALLKEGLFDAALKKPLPLLPRKIGVVTSPTGAAVRDILSVLERRYPDRHVILAPVPVQGEQAAPSIARAIDYFDREGSVDVLIVGRGGGSIEDLWAFNERVVAEALHRCSIPVISAVGHETDFTISDFVADVRAPTPSAGAELVIGRKQDFLHQVGRLDQRLRSSLRQRTLYLKGRLSEARSHRLFHEPALVVSGHRRAVARLEDRMDRCLRREITQPRRQLAETALHLRHQAEHHTQRSQRLLDELGQRLHQLPRDRVKEQRATLDRIRHQLAAYNPSDVLRRGFSITRTADGEVVRDFDALSHGDELVTLTHQGSLHSRLERLVPKESASDDE